MTGDSADRYGVMGYPIAHSRSPLIHRLFAEQTGQDLRYDLLEVKPDELETAVREFQRSGGKGLNITLPHKQAVVGLTEKITDRARRAGAVNTLCITNDNITGDNTDGVGLLRDLCQNLGIGLEGTRILILGAGGATRGIVGPLLEAQPAALRIANRTLQRAEAIADDFAAEGPVSACRFEDVAPGEACDLVINATSAGVQGETPPYPAQAIGAKTVCYDLSYAHKTTPFCRWAATHNAARCVMGWGMLIEQAAESFRLWRGVMPDTAGMLERLTVTA